MASSAVRLDGQMVTRIIPFDFAIAGMQVRTKQRRKIARRQRLPAPLASRPNQSWAMDFVSDRLSDGRSIRILTAVDQFTRMPGAGGGPLDERNQAGLDGSDLDRA